VRSLAVLVAVLALAGTAAAALPPTGVFVPGRSLAGIRLGESASSVRASLGAHGTCLNCTTPTWYFNYHRFERRGLAVELTRGLVSAVYTLWQPAGWRSTNGLRLGVREARLTSSTKQLVTVVCSGGYDARVQDSAAARSVYYVSQGRLWGFGLLRVHANPCR
jgi:hypothetical protein